MKSRADNKLNTIQEKVLGLYYIQWNLKLEFQKI